MIVRTPTAKRSRGPEEVEVVDAADCPLVVPSPPPDSDSHSHPLLCTYQCRQMVKADVLDALANAEKQLAEYETKLEDLNSGFSQADVERKRLRDQLMYAQQELAAARGREHALQERLLKDVSDSQERFKKQLESYSQLEMKLANERDLREKAESATASAEQKVSELEGKLGNLIDTIGREKERLNRELRQLQQESKSSISRIKVDLEKMECRANHAEKESEMLNNELEDMKMQLNECLNQKNELEKKLLGMSYQEGSSTESNVLVKHLQEELRKCESEVREARKLKSKYEGIEILNEKLLEEKSRRERAEADLSRLQSVELNMSKLEEELSSWKSIANNIPGVSCSDDIPMKFAALQKEMIDNMTKLGETTARLKQLEVALETAQFDKQNVETEAAILKEKEESLKHDMKKMKLLISTVTIEKDTLRQVVEELKRTKNDQSGKELIDGNILQGLELSLSQKESCIKELESEINEAKMVSHHRLQEIELLNERLNSEARRIKSLERENDRLLQQISLLESKLGHGDFSAANTKVLRMVNTLALDNEAKETIEALQTELQKAKEKLDAVEELKSQTGDAGMLVDSFISGKITQLKEQIATLEKREERYKTVFADRISVFRKACCELFGYKIIMDEQHRANGIPVTHFTLQSIYAQGDDEKLEFEYESGNTNILANKYTSQPEVSRQVDIFVRRMNSIPAFTANLTVESFNRRTLS